VIDRVRAFVRAIDDDAHDTHGPPASPALACTLAAVSLVLMEYASERAFLRSLYRDHPELYSAQWAALVELGTWVGVRVLGFFVLPALAVKLLGQRLRDQALGPISWRQLGPYAGLFALVLPGLVLASMRPEFVRYYPFYRFAARSWLDLASWELLYAAHFVALEFFFRGWWLTALRPRFGSGAVWVAMVPYCMIHFSKPLLEVLGAIPAGVVLGLLAMRARSIWGGALLHVMVAWTMDALALLQGEGFPRQLTP
jgi:membrane protease YdiL (CAAX protease family)